MTSKNRSAVSGLISGAKAEIEKKRQTQESASKQSDKIERKGCTLYMSRETYERVQRWAAYLDGVAQFELIERALEQYCDKLSETYLDGEEPPEPRDISSTPLP